MYSRQRKCEREGPQQKEVGLFKEEKEGQHGQSLAEHWGEGIGDLKGKGHNLRPCKPTWEFEALNSRGLVPRGKNKQIDEYRKLQRVASQHGYNKCSFC